jgi:hypothetical protein
MESGMKRYGVLLALSLSLAPSSLLAMRSNHAGWHGAAPNMHTRQQQTSKMRNSKSKQTNPAGFPLGLGI